MYNLEILENILVSEGYKTIDDEGKVLPPSDKVYAQISQTMLDRGSVMSKKHIYTHLKQNRCRTLTKIWEYYGVNGPIETEKDKSFELSDSNIVKDVSHNFQLFIAYEKWRQMKPSAKRLLGISYLNFKDPWTSIVADCIWEQQRFLCCFIFKLGRISFTNEAKYYARFKGRCNECRAKLTGRLYNKPGKEKDAIFDCSKRITTPKFSTKIRGH